ncbi:MAG: hypothetical protein BMS9Abin15_0393 [Gammaproteobacteria bacterium]|nr:MAG: hypothetical protein BMS9Abin15_0393 [Gammaproteobacteria bacterium]
MRVLLAGYLVIAMALLSGCDGTPQEQAVTLREQVVTDSATTPDSNNTSVDAGSTQGSPADQKRKATIVYFVETEPDIDPYPTRMIFSDGFLRIDDGEDDTGYILFDQSLEKIYSVFHMEKRVIVITKPEQPVVVPDTLKLTDSLKQLDDAPLVNGVQPLHYTFYSNDKQCYDTIVVPGMLDMEKKMLQNYQSVLSAMQVNTLERTPQELQSPCFLGNYIYGAARHYAHGFPIEEWSDTGKRRSLAKVDTGAEVDSSMFAVPEQYSQLLPGSTEE